MAHYVKCLYCGEQFDRDKVEYIQVSARRYAHPACVKNHNDNKTQEEKDLEQLEQYIMKLFDEPFVNARIRKQIKDYQKEYKYTYLGMYKTLVYWYEIKGNSTEKANGGIGIIPFVYKQAAEYYYALFMAKNANKEKDISNYIPTVKEIFIESPRVMRKPVRLFNLDEEADDE